MLSAHSLGDTDSSGRKSMSLWIQTNRRGSGSTTSPSEELQKVTDS